MSWQYKLSIIKSRLMIMAVSAINLLWPLLATDIENQPVRLWQSWFSDSIHLHQCMHVLEFLWRKIIILLYSSHVHPTCNCKCTQGWDPLILQRVGSGGFCSNFYLFFFSFSLLLFTYFSFSSTYFSQLCWHWFRNFNITIIDDNWLSDTWHS